MFWLVAGGIALAAVAAGIAFSLAGGGDDDGSSSIRGTLTAAGCTYREVKPLPPKNKTNFHADAPSLTSKVKWSTNPPSAGAHYGAWAVWNFWRDVVNPRQLVHNLEHGGVVVWYGPKVPPATVDQLEAFYRESPEGMVASPYPGFGNKIALTAWTGDPATYYRNGDYGLGHIAVCQRFDEGAFEAFRDEFRGKGPEGVPTESNQPGTGP
jgi:hypothetical protein